MILLVDRREQQPLEFPSVQGIEIRKESLTVGDYGAMHGRVRDATVIERKSIADLYHSFTAGYDLERAKILQAKERQLVYVLAIEATCTEILQGHKYWAGGVERESPKSGYSMLKQLMTVQRKYGIGVWFCTSRGEMALRIQEYFLAHERVKE